MIRIDLNHVEGKMLTDILQSYLSDLRMEISNTDRMDFRERLKQEEVFLKKLLVALERQETHG